jgi:hypothetical protein
MGTPQTRSWKNDQFELDRISDYSPPYARGRSEVLRGVLMDIAKHENLV